MKNTNDAVDPKAAPPREPAKPKVEKPNSGLSVKTGLKAGEGFWTP